MQRMLIAFSRAVVKTWEGFQVELQSQYSPTRLEELHTFTRETGVMRATLILLLTPVICTITAVVLDVLPLRPPTGGIHQQSATYWLRVAFVFAVLVSGTILQFQHASPRLQFRTVPFIATTTLLAAVSPLCFLSLHLLVGFPSPFAIQLIGALLEILFFSSLWGMLMNTILGDIEIQRDLRQFMLYSTCLSNMVALYPVMIFVFGNLAGIQQTLFSFAFPVLKLMYKNWASRGLYRLEDLAPVYVVVSMDVFHSLLLSSAIQSATSRGALVSVMAVDVIQSVIALVEVRTIVNRLERLHREVPTPEAAPFALSRSHRQTDILSLACSFLVRHPDIRTDPTVGLPRHRRQVPSLAFSTRTVLLTPKRATRVACASMSANARPAINSRAAEIDFVRFTLKLLHMIEFYLLIEFIEVVVAIIYAIYLTAMFYLPNRAYYPTVRGLTGDQSTETVTQVLQYAALEMLSLGVFCVVLDWFSGLSTLRLLAFTLHKHAVLAQSQLTIWVFMSTQFSLEHFGCDYTFRFAWLRHPPNTADSNGTGDTQSAT